LRRFQLLRRELQDLGIEPERFQLEWISASEGEKVKSVINNMVAAVRSWGRSICRAGRCNGTRN